jgi:hypothetical protein
MTNIPLLPSASFERVSFYYFHLNHGFSNVTTVNSLQLVYPVCAYLECLHGTSKEPVLSLYLWWLWIFDSLFWSILSNIQHCSESWAHSMLHNCSQDSWYTIDPQKFIWSQSCQLGISYNQINDWFRGLLYFLPSLLLHMGWTWSKMLTMHIEWSLDYELTALIRWFIFTNFVANKHHLGSASFVVLF